MALDKVKVIGKIGVADLVLVPIEENGTMVYKMYQVCTDIFDTDERVYEEIGYKAPHVKESFSMDSDITVDGHGIIVLDSMEPAVMQKYHSKAKGAVESRTIGNYMYDTVSNQELINNRNIRIGRSKHNGGTLSVYHTTKFVASRGEDGDYVHNFYHVTGHKKVLEPMFGNGIKATKTRPTLLAESKPILDVETQENETFYVNTHNMTIYEGLYGYLTDKNRKNDRYDMFKDSTNIASQDTRERIADLEFRLRAYRNTTSVSKHVLNRFEAAVEKLKANPTVANYYHAKLVQEIIEAQVAKGATKLSSAGDYLDKKIKVLAKKEAELTFGADGM